MANFVAHIPHKLPMYRILFFIVLLYCSSTYAQFVKPHAQLKADLKKHILFLANDSLQGRATGTRGETIALDYIVKQYKALGLQPMLPYDNYIQPFKFTSKVYLGKKNSLKYIESGNNGNFPLYKAFYPLNNSGNGVAFARAVTMGFGISAPKMNHDDYAPMDKEQLKGKIFVIKVGYPDAKIHSAYAAYDIDFRIDLAIKNGAAGIVFINDQDSAFNPDSSLKVKSNRKSIPIVFCSDKRITAIGRQSKDPVFFIETEIIKEEKTGHNAIAFIDNKKDTTVVIGAHYDHLGMGEISGSLHKGKPEAHNGADDNASGVAALLELASQLKNDPNTANNNYIFVAFSGEELGLYGSSHFVADMGFGVRDFNYMLNMDMIGRLDSTKNILAVNGTGTSPQWGLLDSIKNIPFSIKKSESGVGPSDHTSFYKEKIPVLHFFTGNHMDYHKPNDDEIYINYEGEAQVIYYIYHIILQMDKQGKLTFTPTKDIETSRTQYKVTMGIMPDYMYEASGIKVDGVTAEKPAGKAGIQKGDIIIELGGIKTNDMLQYMKALGEHNKGDKVPCKILRGGKELMLQVVF